MPKDTTTKKRVIISYNHLSPELQEELRKKYPAGYTDSMIRVDKGPGDFFYGVVLETEDTNYLVKITVNIDEQIEEEEEEKEYFNDDIKGAEDLIADSEQEEEDD